MKEIKYKIGDLRQRQSLPLDAKIQLAKRRIQEWYDAHDGNVFVSFSGGKDSTVLLLHLVRELYPDVPAVFVDTGLEFPEIREFAKSLDNVIVLRPDMSFRKVITTIGYPIGSKEIAAHVDGYHRGQPSAIQYCKREKMYNGKPSKFCLAKRWDCLLDAPFKVSAKCCKIMKEDPMDRYSKQTGQMPYIGMLAEESRRRVNAWLRSGCNAYDTKKPSSRPLMTWTESDVLEYIVTRNIEIASIYGKIVKDEETGTYSIPEGHYRTGCVFCGFGAHLEKPVNRFQLLLDDHPQLYEYCMRPTDQGGLGMREVLEYCGIPWKKEE